MSVIPSLPGLLLLAGLCCGLQLVWFRYSLVRATRTRR